MEKDGQLDGRKYNENNKDSQMGQVTPKKFLKKTAQVLVRVRIKKYCELRYCDTAILR